jgi:hypothetical protein
VSDNGHKTPSILPALLPENRPLATVLIQVANEIELSGVNTADALRDMARAVQIGATDVVGQKTKDRIADLVDKHGGAVKRAAQRVREA